MTTRRIDPKTRRVIVSDLSPAHRDKATGVHGVGTGTILSSQNVVCFDDEIIIHDNNIVYN